MYCRNKWNPACQAVASKNSWKWCCKIIEAVKIMRLQIGPNIGAKTGENGAANWRQCCCWKKMNVTTTFKMKWECCGNFEINIATTWKCNCGWGGLRQIVGTSKMKWERYGDFTNDMRTLWWLEINIATTCRRMLRQLGNTKLKQKWLEIETWMELIARVA